MPPHAAVQTVDLIADQGHDDHEEHEELEMPAVGSWGDIAPVEDLGRAVPGHDAGGVEHHEEELGAHPTGQNGDPVGQVRGPTCRPGVLGGGGLRPALIRGGARHCVRAVLCRRVEIRRRANASPFASVHMMAPTSRDSRTLDHRNR